MQNSKPSIMYFLNIFVAKRIYQWSEADKNEGTKISAIYSRYTSWTFTKVHGS